MLQSIAESVTILLEIDLTAFFKIKQTRIVYIKFLSIFRNAKLIIIAFKGGPFRSHPLKDRKVDM